jgi:phosphoenolpyruvate carboxylase
VPGYFGIGTALNQLKMEGRIDELKLLFQNAPFFRILILNAMMSLSKSNFKLTTYMAKDKDYQEFWHILNDEYELSKAMLLLISGYESLMEEEPITKKSIQVREQIVLPLLVIQQFALQMIEKNDSNKAVYEKMVTRSLYGNINASRNSA